MNIGLNKLFSNELSQINFNYNSIHLLEYYKRIITLIRKGGVIVLDNMLWSGEVISPKDDHSKVLNKTAKFINEDERVFNTLLPIRDGLMVCYKK